LFCGSDGKGRKYNCFGLARSVIEEMDVSETGKTNYVFTGESCDPQVGLIDISKASIRVHRTFSSLDWIKFHGNSGF
jgi:hypothetical protein